MALLATIFSKITWRPGFNDNDFSGWLVTAAYVLAVTACFASAWRSRKNTNESPNLFQIWTRLGALLLLLGVNQQLDLQTLMIEVGRAVSSEQGWNESRRLVQKVFFGMFAVILTAFGIILAVQWRDFLKKNRLVTFGLMILLGFILMRAASIDHVSETSLETVNEDSWKDYLELSGLVLIVVGVVAESKGRRASG